MQFLAASAAVLALLPPAPVAPELPSRALGKPWDGRLQAGVQLPVESPAHFTWDWGLRVVPNRDFRRWGTQRTVATTLTIIAQHRAAFPDAPRVGVADLSRPEGGVFDARYGGQGHASHQNGLDVDVLYPRRDRVEKAPLRPAQVDRRLAQDLVNRFTAAGAEFVFVGRKVKLTGPKKVVVPIGNHEDHLHVRFRP